MRTAGSKLVIKWDIGNSQTTFETEYLLLESTDDDNFQDHSTSSESDLDNIHSSSLEDVVEGNTIKQVSKKVIRSKHVKCHAKEEVYLCLQKKRLFKAKYSKCEISSLVNNKLLL